MWKHKDYGFNDIEYEVDRRKRSAESRNRTAETIKVIDDMMSDEVTYFYFSYEVETIS